MCNVIDFEIWVDTHFLMKISIPTHRIKPTKNCNKEMTTVKFPRLLGFQRKKTGYLLAHKITDFRCQSQPILVINPPNSIYPSSFQYASIFIYETVLYRNHVNERGTYACKVLLPCELFY